MSTDNGGLSPSSNYPLRGAKHTIWEGGVRGAAFAHGWGLRKAAGTVTRELMHGADWLQTLVVSVAGGSAAGALPLDGVDQWKVLSAGAATARAEVVYGHEGRPSDCGLRQGNWKLLREGGDKPDTWDKPGYGLNGSAAVAGQAAPEAAVPPPPAPPPPTPPPPPLPPPPSTMQPGVLYNDTDILSDNIAHADLASWQDCRAACAARAGCAAFSFDARGQDVCRANEGVCCWLKGPNVKPIASRGRLSMLLPPHGPVGGLADNAEQQ